MWNKISNSKVFYAIVAVICAIACWLLVDITQEYDGKTTLYNIPVTFVGENILAEQGLMIVDGEDTTVTLTISGPRSALAHINRSNVTITVQAAQQISGEGEYSLVYNETFPASVSATSVRVTERSVETIPVKVVQMTSQTLNIVGHFTGTPAEGTLVDENGFQFENPTVTISGERSLVEQVASANVYLDTENLSETFTGMLDVVLEDAEGNVLETQNLTMDISEVYTVFPILTVKEVPLTVTFQAGGGATKEDITSTIDPETITISGTQEVLDQIDSINLGTIDLSQVITSDTLTFDIILPDNVSNITGTSSAAVNVTVNGLTTRTVEISDIRFVNLQEELTAKAVTQSLTVRIRGDAEVMKNVLDSDIYAEVDLATITDAGTRTLPATIRVQGFSDIGAIDSYQVVVSTDFAPLDGEAPLSDEG